VRDKKLLPLEEAIRKMTALPASALGLPDRGQVRAGNVADLVVFDLTRVRDLATYERPQRLAEGIDTILIAGQVVRAQGKATGARPGRVLRHTP
jgi:N-acyl-D-amino-acid deacylase